MSYWQIGVYKRTRTRARVTRIIIVLNKHKQPRERAQSVKFKEEMSEFIGEGEGGWGAFLCSGT